METFVGIMKWINAIFWIILIIWGITKREDIRAYMDKPVMEATMNEFILIALFAALYVKLLLIKSK